ncbi:hypothetical protein [Gimesia aquarii]|uniref:Uncharacterized protein n=1 Tax=Gimesia aquarii TaxID=2527964 RepID=A0A517VW86_9PLAN|nr:hypothetical protein [Gimesia aquarii]QDT97263.1 hypothetical protein V144x_27350 [Gimesia aquarii]
MKTECITQNVGFVRSDLLSLYRIRPRCAAAAINVAAGWTAGCVAAAAACALVANNNFDTCVGNQNILYVNCINKATGDYNDAIAADAAVATCYADADSAYADCLTAATDAYNACLDACPVE